MGPGHQDEFGARSSGSARGTHWRAALPGGMDTAEQRACRGTCDCQAGEDERAEAAAPRRFTALSHFEKTKNNVICRWLA